MQKTLSESVINIELRKELTSRCFLFSVGRIGIGVWPFLFCRLAIPDKPSPASILDVKNEIGFHNNTGLAIQLLIDVQKLVGCQMVADEEKDNNYYPAEIMDIKTRVQQSEKYSARVNLVFRSNPILKTGLQNSCLETE